MTSWLVSIRRMTAPNSVPGFSEVCGRRVSYRGRNKIIRCIGARWISGNGYVLNDRAFPRRNCHELAAVCNSSVQVHDELFLEGFHITPPRLSRHTARCNEHADSSDLQGR